MPPVPILSHNNKVHDSPSNFLNININIIVPIMPRSSKRSLSTKSPHQNPVRTFPVSDTCHTIHPSHSDLITRVILVRCKKHEAPRYVFFSTPPFPCPLQVTPCNKSFLLLGACTPRYSRQNFCLSSWFYVQHDFWKERHDSKRSKTWSSRKYLE